MRLITAVGGVLMALTTPITTAEEVSQSQSQSQALPSCTEKYALQSTKSSEDFLTSILNPITINDFFENHFQKKAASSQRPGMPGYYGPMVSFEDVEYAMENGFKVSNPNKRLIYGKDWKLAKRVYRDDEYWTGIYSNEEEEMSVEEAMRAVSQGFTVIMNGVQSCMPNVYQSAWQLETALGYHVNVNLYISPQGGSQGFEAHLDWMDGFIFQITGQKRWNVYEPALVSYPRPDMVRKPPISFIETDSVESDLQMRAGDFAYIPRGIVHQAHTSAQDLGENQDDVYRQASMHLTFGLELAKDASVEMLMHHFVAKLPPAAFAKLADSQHSSTPATPPYVFESDDGSISFSCGSSVELIGITGARCLERDVIHLMLAAMAGYISNDEDAFINDSAYLEQQQNVFSTALLRKAVGLTKKTTKIPSLDPRRLISQGIELFSQAALKLGVKELIHFLMEKSMITLVYSRADNVCTVDHDESCVSDESAPAFEKLHASSGTSQNYTTLGSDFSCDYIDNFLSKSFKQQGTKQMDLQIHVSNNTVWESLIDGQDRSTARSYNRNAVQKFLSEISWTKADTAISDFIRLEMHEAATRPFPSKPMSRKWKNHKTLYNESITFCDAWMGMMDTINKDKSRRKKSGLVALENAGYQMNAS